MRDRYDESGNCIRKHNMLFDEIPDDYVVKKVILDDKVFDLSSLGVMKHIRSTKKYDFFDDNAYYSRTVLSYLAMDYLESAKYLQRGIVADRGGEIITNYFIPCAFLCKHAIELKIKECLIAEGAEELNGHSALVLWNQIKTVGFPHYDELQSFIMEIEKIDKNEMALRYGVSSKLEPLSENYKFDIDNLIQNTMFLFNVLDEYVICANQ